MFYRQFLYYKSKFVKYHSTVDNLIDEEALRRVAKQPKLPLEEFANILNNEGKCPAVFFEQSQMGCERLAHSVKTNLVTGQRVPRPKPGATEFEMEAFRVDCAMQSKFVSAKAGRFNRIYHRYLQPHEHYLKSMPEFPGFLAMLRRGVAFHHAGMMPVLREFVEVLYNDQLIMFCFATSTMAVGINMPTKTVIFGDMEIFQRDGNVVPLEVALANQMRGRASLVV